MPTFINHKYKFIFLSGLHCSNRSTVVMFYKSDKNFFGKQIKFKMNKPPYDYDIFTEKGKPRKSFKSLKWYIKKYPKLWKDYTKVVVIRNPYDRLVGWWHSCFRKGYSEGKKTIKGWLKHRKGSNILHYCKDNEGNLCIDETIRYENRIEDIKRVFIDKLKIPNLEPYLEHNSYANLEVKKRPHYSYYYTDKNAKLLESFPAHKKELDLFNYKFERKVNHHKPKPIYADKMGSW